MKNLTRFAAVALMASMLSGCFLTKIVTTPMRIVGAGGAVLGAGLSIIPVAGNTADASLEKVDAAIDQAADTIDDVPI